MQTNGLGGENLENAFKCLGRVKLDHRDSLYSVHCAVEASAHSAHDIRSRNSSHKEQGINILGMQK